MGWTSGAVFDGEAADAAAAAHAAEAAALAALRYAPGNARVFFDITINDQPAGRVRTPLLLYVRYAFAHYCALL